MRKTKSYNTGFGLKSIQKLLIPARRYTKAHDDLLVAMRSMGMEKPTIQEQAIRMSKLLLNNPANFNRIASLPKALAPHKPGGTHASYTADLTWTTIVGCFNRAECPLGCRGICNRCERNTSMDMRATSTASFGKARDAYHKSGVPQLLSDFPVREFTSGTSVFVDIGSELFHPAVPIEHLEAVFDTTQRFPNTTFVFCTRRFDRFFHFITNGRYGVPFSRGEMNNVLFMFSISTQGEADALGRMWHQLDPALKLKCQLSLRPLLEDHILLPGHVLKDKRILDIAGTTAGRVDWPKEFSAEQYTEYAEYTRRAMEMQQHVKRVCGKTIVMDTYGEVMPIATKKLKNGKIRIVERGVSMRKADPNALVTCKGGAHKRMSVHGHEITTDDIITASNGMEFLPVSHSNPRAYSGPSMEMPEFKAAQLQAPVEG